MANLVEQLQNIDAHFISVTQQIDTSNSCGKLSFNMLAAIAQFEREIASELVRDKIESSKIQGLWCGGSVPFGYKAENKKLVISEENARIVRNVFKEFVNGSSINNILNELRSYGLKTTKGNNLTSNIIKNMLKNPTYIGKVQLKGLLYDGVHKAIVDYDTWNKAQEMLLEMKRNAPVRKKQLITKIYISGLVYCGDCNKILTPTYTTKIIKNVVNIYQYINYVE